MTDKTKARVVRELAEKVLGWEYSHTEDDCLWFRKRPFVKGLDRKNGRLDFPSTDGNMTIFDPFGDLNDTFLLLGEFDAWLLDKRFASIRIKGKITQEFSDTPQEAINLAVCKARGIEVGDE